MKTPGKVIGLKIESYRPEDSLKSLALQLSSLLAEESNARNDARTFKEQAFREREKAKQMSNVLVMLQEYNRKKQKALSREEDWSPSRMEPMESYDENTIKSEKLLYLERAKELDQKAIEFEKNAEQAKKKGLEIQRKMTDVSTQ